MASALDSQSILAAANYFLMREVWVTRLWDALKGYDIHSVFMKHSFLRRVQFCKVFICYSKTLCPYLQVVTKNIYNRFEKLIIILEVNPPKFKELHALPSAVSIDKIFKPSDQSLQMLISPGRVLLRNCLQSQWKVSFRLQRCLLWQPFDDHALI